MITLVEILYDLYISVIINVNTRNTGLTFMLIADGLLYSRSDNFLCVSNLNVGSICPDHPAYTTPVFTTRLCSAEGIIIYLVLSDRCLINKTKF